MEINKAIGLGLEWAEKRMASELTEMDKEYLLTGIKVSLVKNCSVPDDNQQREILLKFSEFINKSYNLSFLPDEIEKYCEDLMRMKEEL